MLSLLPSVGSAVASSSSTAAVLDQTGGPKISDRELFAKSVARLCIVSNSMGGNSGPAIPRIPPIIMAPLTTTCTTTTTCDYSPPSPRLYPSPYSPAGVPYYAQSSTSSSSVSTTTSGPPPHPLPPHHLPSSPAAQSPNYYYPFSHPNPYSSRNYIQIDPNYSAVALAAGLQNPSAAAQLRPFPRTAPIYAVSPGLPAASSPTQYSVFPFPPPHHLSLHPPINPFSTASSNVGDHPTIPLFANSPARLASISPDDRSPNSVSPQSQISSHHSSSPGVISATANLKNYDPPAHSTSSSHRSATAAAAEISIGRDLSLKSRLLVRPSNAASNQMIGQSDDNPQRHPRNVTTTTAATYYNVNSSTSFPPSSSVPSNSIISNVNLDHVVNKLRSSPPKRQKSSSSSSSSSSTSRPPSLQPTAGGGAQSNNLQQQQQLIKENSNATNSGCTNSIQPLYPAHFNKGSIIQLSDKVLKCVEDLCTDDFIKSAEQSDNLQIDSSTVVRIEISSSNSRKAESTVILGFAVGAHKLQVSVEASLEHPFFVIGKGWSSCSPTRSMQRYSLVCHQLIVGDVCISLTHKKNGQRKANSSTAANQSVYPAVGGRSNAVSAIPHESSNPPSLPPHITHKTQYLGGRGGAVIGAKRKRRWSESDATDCHVLPAVNKSGGHDAITNAKAIEPKLKIVS